MTKFADQLFDDLMREHGPTLARTPAPPPARRHVRRTVLAAGGAGLAAAAIAGVVVVPGGGRVHVGNKVHTNVGDKAPAGAVTTNPDGTITLAVDDKSGIAGINARLRQLGDNRVVVVPVRPGCPSPRLAPPHALRTLEKSSRGGTITVTASGIPAGDILVVGVKSTAGGRVSAAVLAKPPAPSCLSLPAPKAP